MGGFNLFKSTLEDIFIECSKSFNRITGWRFQIIFYFHPYLGKIPILTNIFQTGWFNHQPDKIENNYSSWWFQIFFKDLFTPNVWGSWMKVDLRSYLFKGVVAKTT